MRERTVKEGVATGRRPPRTPRKVHVMAYAFIAPLVLGSVAFIFAPMVLSFWWSLTDYNGITAPNFVGLKNYVDLFGDPKFRASLVNTCLFVTLGMAVGPALGLATALLLNMKVKLQGFFRTAYFLPVMTSSIVVALVWRLLYNNNGILNYLLGSLGIGPIAWLSNPKLAIFSITAAGIWQGFGFETVVFLAALQSIPKELHEAAKLDGAGPWQRFLHVTLPALRPVMFFVFCVGIIGSFQVFDLPYALMNAKPNPGPEYATLVYYLFAKFRDLRLGPASAIAYVLFLILLVISVIQWRFRGEKE